MTCLTVILSRLFCFLSVLSSLNLLFETWGRPRRLKLFYKQGAGDLGACLQEGRAGYSPVSILSVPKPSPEGHVVLCQGSCQEREGLPSSWFHSKVFRLDASPGNPEGHSGQAGGGRAPRGQMTQEEGLHCSHSGTYGLA